MKIIQDTSTQHLEQVFFDEFLQALGFLFGEERIIIGLSGGSSFDIFYSFLGDHFHEINSEVRDKISFALLDERIIEIQDTERNEHQLRSKFLDILVKNELLNESQILSVDIGKGDIASEYSKRVPKIHIGFFGVGPDGHIASLFPHHALLQSEIKGYLEIIDAPKPPPHRITVSPLLISDIDFVFVAFMRGKEDAYNSFLDQTKSREDVPVKLVSSAKKVVVLSNIDR